MNISNKILGFFCQSKTAHIHCQSFAGEASEFGPDGETEQRKAEQVRIGGSIIPFFCLLGGMGLASRMVDLNGGAVETAYRWG